ncbi:MAG: hypothetical protein MO846_08665 [Candidatus Devosia symbiotica]|nr:hypothetical protein [Candidatus Devosia symbiotica]
MVIVSIRTIKILFWLVFTVTVGVYGTILFWFLPLISNAVGGLASFDMQPEGVQLCQREGIASRIAAGHQ